jgi:hypothetical protein
MLDMHGFFGCVQTEKKQQTDPSGYTMLYPTSMSKLHLAWLRWKLNNYSKVPKLESPNFCSKFGGV